MPPLILGEGGDGDFRVFALLLSLLFFTFIRKNILKTKRGIILTDLEFGLDDLSDLDDIDVEVSGLESFDPGWEFEVDDVSRKQSVLDDEIERYLEEWRESLLRMCMLCGCDVEEPYKAIEWGDIATFCLCEGCWSAV